MSFAPLIKEAALKKKLSREEMRAKELEMWHTWKDRGESPQDMEPLLQSLQPVIQSQVRKFRGTPIHREVLRGEATRITLHALRKYDPTKAAIHTHLYNQMRGLQRFVIKHQNLSRITEDRASKIGRYQRAIDHLTDRFGREPTSQEIADEANITVQDVTNLGHELRADMIASGTPDDPFIDETPRVREVTKLIRFELGPEELLVFEYLTGTGGKPKITSTGTIATKLNWSASKVSQKKLSIKKHYDKWL